LGPIVNKQSAEKTPHPSVGDKKGRGEVKKRPSKNQFKGRRGRREPQIEFTGCQGEEKTGVPNLRQTFGGQGTAKHNVTVSVKKKAEDHRKGPYPWGGNRL